MFVPRANQQGTSPADFTRPYVKCKPDDKREHPRLSCKGIAELRIFERETLIRATLMDLSVTGCCVECSGPCETEVGSAVEVHLSVNGIRLRIGGVVRNIRRERRAGIEFTGVSSRKEEQIKQLVRELARRTMGG